MEANKEFSRFEDFSYFELAACGRRDANPDEFSVPFEDAADFLDELMVRSELGPVNRVFGATIDSMVEVILSIYDVSD